jgi:hypothetical protein
MWDVKGALKGISDLWWKNSYLDVRPSKRAYCRKLGRKGGDSVWKGVEEITSCTNFNFQISFPKSPH